MTRTLCFCMFICVQILCVAFNMNDCVFCKIIADEIPSNKVYEDEYVYAFYDIAPKAKTHILLIPKLHFEGAAQVDEGNSVYVARIYQVIAKLVKELGVQDGFRVVTNCGPKAGQTVYHLHFHLMADDTEEFRSTIQF